MWTDGGFPLEDPQGVGFLLNQDADPKPAVGHAAMYCTPHMEIPGILFASSALLHFEPDALQEHVIEVGVEQYTVLLEVSDIMGCGAISLPFGSEGREDRLAFFLQLQIRTLDGQSFCSSEDMEDAWILVFRFHEREHIRELANFTFDAIEECRRKANISEATPVPLQSRTQVPFACLECMAELESAQHRKMERQFSQGQEQAAEQLINLDPSQLITSLASLLAGPSQPSCEDTQASLSPGAAAVSFPFWTEQVTLRLPENCERSLLTKDLADSLRGWLPVNLRLPGVVEWVLRYSPKAHGVSFSTLFRNMATLEKSIVIIQDTEDYIFGGFAPAVWAPFSKFYGSGEAFVFSFGVLRQDQAVEDADVKL
eukprot:TRINITY_DN17878_c0_g2_i1.p1 TRINITY_DN17878_c0_g2~~TRINITY_DN17878_c0_g2_i1.p1  ORF type:complete len:370 (-),score=78.35 TRINITY_DN17878_c0_g2_i1:39-1148(-)